MRSQALLAMAAAACGIHASQPAAAGGDVPYGSSVYVQPQIMTYYRTPYWGGVDYLLPPGAHAAQVVHHGGVPYAWYRTRVYYGPRFYGYVGPAYVPPPPRRAAARSPYRAPRRW